MIDKSKTPILISMPRSGSHYVGNYIREHYKSNGMLFPSIWSSEIFSNHQGEFPFSHLGLNQLIRYFEDTRNTFNCDIFSIFHAPHLMDTIDLPSRQKHDKLFDWFKEFYDGYKIFLLRRKNIWKTYMSFLFHTTVATAYKKNKTGDTYKGQASTEAPWHNIEGKHSQETLKSTIQLVNPKFVHNEQLFYKFCSHTNYFEEEIITYYLKGNYDKNLIMNYWLEDLNDELLTDWFVAKHRRNNFVMEEKYKPFSIKYETYYKKFDLQVIRDKFMKVYDNEFKHYGYVVD